LTELGEGTQDTRRRASIGELVGYATAQADVRKVLEVLAAARLITLGPEAAEVAHEALIREWPRLREWLAQDRESLRLERQLGSAAEEWLRQEILTVNVKRSNAAAGWDAEGSQAWATAVSPDGTLLATGGADRTARVWDASSGRLQPDRHGRRVVPEP
jgi:hypothetical protein